MRQRISHLFLACASAALLFLLSGIPAAAQQKDAKIKYELKEFLGLQIPPGLDVFALRIPADNPITPEKVELGRLLFFDRALSNDNTVSCADCHHPNLAFTDGRPVATGIRGQKGGRSAPTLINRAFSASQFWDGRAGSLEQQAKGPMLDPLEMGNRSHEDIVVRLERLDVYRGLFKEAFGTESITIDRVAQAIATFERTLLSGNSPFDRHQRGDAGAVSASARRGFDLFRGKAQCDTCHTGFNFTDEQFHTLGSSYQRSDSDFGLFNVTKRQGDKGKFKTPTLREIANTGPYMHDGRFRTLEEVVDFYGRGGLDGGRCAPAGIGGLNSLGLPLPVPGALPRVLQQRLPAGLGSAPTEIVPLNLSQKDKRDLVEFLKSLSGEGWQHVESPERIP
jgi:cytochrome c peroxidase